MPPIPAARSMPAPAVVSGVGRVSSRSAKLAKLKQIASASEARVMSGAKLTGTPAWNASMATKCVAQVPVPNARAAPAIHTGRTRPPTAAARDSMWIVV